MNNKLLLYREMSDIIRLFIIIPPSSVELSLFEVPHSHRKIFLMMGMSAETSFYHSWNRHISNIFLFLIRLFNKEFLLCFCSYSSCSIAFFGRFMLFVLSRGFQRIILPASSLSVQALDICSHGKQVISLSLIHRFV